MTNYKNISADDYVQYDKEIMFMNMLGYQYIKIIVQQGYVVTICNENGIMKAVVAIGNDRFGLITCDYVDVEKLEVING